MDWESIFTRTFIRLIVFNIDLLLRYTWDPIYYVTGGDEAWSFPIRGQKLGDAKMTQRLNR